MSRLFCETWELPLITSLRLHRFAIVFYAGRVLVFGFAPQTMQRLTARFLLLFALFGTFVPLVLAATAAPQHSCCLRKAAHQCHTTATDSDQRTIHGAGCCNHDSCRAVTTSQWADPQPSLAPLYAPNVEGCIAVSHAGALATELFASQSTRAPPQVSLA
jgi:hypothetical protein